MKIVHAADLHIDSPLRGLARYPGAPADAIRAATRRATENLVTLCVEEEASLLLLAGDLFDGAWKDYGTGLFLASELGRLRDVGTRVVLIRGNHDAQSVVAKNLRWPAHVIELGSKKPETVELEDLGVAVHGQSFAQRAVTDDLSARYPPPVRGAFNVGLLHTCAEGREGHDPYAPTSVGALAAKGYDYWALGHVHAREVLAREPWIVFPGNLQGRHARETGAKGATLLTVEAGRVASVEHRALDVVRWESLAVDADGSASMDELVDRVEAAFEEATEAAEDRTLAARVVVSGGARARSLAADREKLTNELRAAASRVRGGRVFFEKVVFKLREERERPRAPVSADALAELLGALADTPDDDELAAVAADLGELKKRLPPELAAGPDALGLDDPEVVRALAKDAIAWLGAALMGERA